MWIMTINAWIKPTDKPTNCSPESPGDCFLESRILYFLSCIVPASSFFFFSSSQPTGHSLSSRFISKACARTFPSPRNVMLQTTPPTDHRLLFKHSWSTSSGALTRAHVDGLCKERGRRSQGRAQRISFPCTGKLWFIYSSRVDASHTLNDDDRWRWRESVLHVQDGMCCP